MPNKAVEQTTGGSAWQAKQVYAMAELAWCLAWRSATFFADPNPPRRRTARGGNQPAVTAGPMGGQMSSLEDMKKMADAKAAPLLEKLKSDPTNKDVLVQVGNL